MCPTARPSRREVSRWEREVRVPTGPWLRSLAVVLGVPLAMLEFAAATSPGKRADIDVPGGRLHTPYFDQGDIKSAVMSHPATNDGPNGNCVWRLPP